MISRPVTTMLLKQRRKAMKKMRNGMSPTFTKHPVQRTRTTMMMTTTTTIDEIDPGIVVFDPGNSSLLVSLFGSIRTTCRSPEDETADNREQESKRKKCTPINAKDQLKSMMLSRFRMEKYLNDIFSRALVESSRSRWCHAPFFAQVARGAFVRINIGQNNGAPVYRVKTHRPWIRG